MLRGLFGTSAITNALRGGLEELSATHRVIADRVAGALDASSSVDFAQELAAHTAKAQQTEADLERDMASLADTQLRYEADAKLLQQAYARLRSAMRERG
jgi:hypothetical protein